MLSAKFHLESLLLPLLLLGSVLQLGDFVFARFFLPLFSLIFVIGFFLIFKQKLAFDNYLRVCLWHWIIFILIIFLSLSSAEEKIFDLVKVSFAFLIFATVHILASQVSRKTFNNSLFIYHVAAIFLMLIETYLRIFTGNFFEILGLNFYRLKIDSPFFADSNAAAIFLVLNLTILCVSIVASRGQLLKRYSFLLFIITYIVLLVLTFSRSAWIATLLLFFVTYFYLIRHRPSLLMFSVLLFFLAAAILISEFSSIIMSDDSLLTKIGVYSGLWEQYSNVTLHEAIFGVGINSGNYLYSYEEGGYSHTLLSMLLGYFGLAGLLCYISFFLFLLGLRFMPVFLVFGVVFTMGLSYIHPFVETIFLALALTNHAVRKSEPHFQVG